MAFRSGIVAMLGKPNVGKSTLLNRMVGQKVSIVSNKPQTTRRRVLGIVQGSDYQVAFIDTPGIHEPHTTLGRAMVESARQALDGVDAILYVADASKNPDELDRRIAKLVLPDTGSAGKPGLPEQSEDTSSRHSSPVTRHTRSADPSHHPAPITHHAPRTPVVLGLNKMDLLAADMVVSHVEAYTSLFKTEDYMLTTATKGHNVSELLQMVVDKLPEGEPLYPEDEYTDQPMRFLAAEIIREKVLLHTKQEVPHATAVNVTDWKEEDGLVRIEAVIVVEKQGQKAILIGRQGSFIKTIGTEARLELQQLLEQPIYLDLHVKVREDWRMNPRMLHELEYTE